MALRNRPIFRAFRLAKVWHYGAVVALRAPLVIAGVVVYTLALRLFGGSVSFGEMLGYLPVIFFGAATPGPMHSVAILFWVLLFPDKAGPDDRLRLRPAQFLYLLQRRNRPAISPAGDSGAVRVAS